MCTKSGEPTTLVLVPMGSAQSYISSELINVALTGIAIAGAVGISYGRHVKQNDDGISDNPKKRKGRTKGPPERVSSRVISSGLSGPQVTETSDTIMPGQFDANSPPVTQNSLAPDNVILKPKKSKRKKNKDAQDAEKISSITAEYHSESSMQTVYKSRIITKRSPQPQTPGIPLRPEIPSLISTTSLDTDDSWTQVGSRHPRQPIRVPPYGESQSEAGASQKDERSPVQNAAEDDPHDSFLLQQSVLPSSRDVENRKTLAKKLLPRPRKPGVDECVVTPSFSNFNHTHDCIIIFFFGSMLETSEYPNPARVIRVAPLLNENPAAGLSWADYVDVRVSTDGGENDADGEDDGWGVVTSKRPSASTQYFLILCFY